MTDGVPLRVVVGGQEQPYPEIFESDQHALSEGIKILRRCGGKVLSVTQQDDNGTPYIKIDYGLPVVLHVIGATVKKEILLVPTSYDDLVH